MIRNSEVLSAKVAVAVSELADMVISEAQRGHLRAAYLPRLTTRIADAVRQWQSDLDFDCPVCASKVTIADKNFCPECEWKEEK